MGLKEVKGDPIYSLPPEEMIPQAMMLAEQLADSRDWGHEPLDLANLQQLADGSNVKVAVLDTGVDFNHPDLDAREGASKDFTGSRSGANDVQGHGTHCAGVIGASADGRGIIGCAPKVTLYNGKVLGDNGSGYSSWIASGINWAVSQGVDIISMSLGSSSPDSRIQSAVQAAVRQGVIVVAAAGNEGPRDGTVGYPGGFDECVCVGAVDSSLKVADFSSRGRQVDVTSPGVAILSTYPGSRYARMSGTSMATPYVAGCIALYLDYLKRKGKDKPNYVELLKLLSKTSKDLGTPGLDNSYGWGLVQPANMFATVEDDVPPPPPPPVDDDYIDISVAELVEKGVKTVRVSFLK